MTKYVTDEHPCGAAPDLRTDATKSGLAYVIESITKSHKLLNSADHMACMYDIASCYSALAIYENRGVLRDPKALASA